MMPRSVGVTVMQTEWPGDRDIVAMSMLFLKRECWRELSPCNGRSAEVTQVEGESTEVGVVDTHLNRSE